MQAQLQRQTVRLAAFLVLPVFLASETDASQIALAALEDLAAAPVKVDIFENMAPGDERDLTHARPAEIYTERAFGFVRTPTKYSRNALPLDRSNPFVLRAELTRALAPGRYEFRLRAKGAARFLIDDQILLTTQPQTGNTSGHDDVPPPRERTSLMRPPQYPHQDEVTTFQTDGRRHAFTLVAVIGGKGLVPAPGELSVSFNRIGEIPRLLGDDSAPLLTDGDWEKFAAESNARHQAADLARRRIVSTEVAAAWQLYHQKIRDWIKPMPSIDPPKVSPGTPVFNEIDRFIGARLEAAHRPPTSLTSDLEFLRRLSLDTIGIIPAPEDIRRFLRDPPNQRRQRAIDRFLANPGWADHWVSYWQDVLAENPGILKPDLNNSGPFRWWLHQSFTDNIPFDRLVAELIEMEGSTYQGAPAAFRLATLNDAPMAAKADILSQAFLAEKLSCARCHDAPDHPHHQKDTFNLAAMLEGKSVKLPKSSTVPLVEGFRQPRVQVTLKPGEEIQPHWPFEMLAKPSPLTALVPVSSTAPATRSQVATLFVSPANKRFAQVVVNRVWKRYIGIGLVEPVEDWDQRSPSHRALLDYLARQFILAGYDLKSVARLILSSHVYQRRPSSSMTAAAELPDRLFDGPARRRLAAEQLVDSLFR
jgi:hypothetical protein